MCFARKFVILQFVLGMVLASSGGILQKWTCETSEMSEHAISMYHGESLDMQCQMLSYGRVVGASGKAEFLWQTNGMDAAWWTTNAVFSGGTVKFRWTPAYDSGADEYRFFFRVTDEKGSNYRANGTLVMEGSPSGDVRYLPLPQKIIDFNQVEIQNATNAPWMIKGMITNACPAFSNAVIDIIKDRCSSLDPATATTEDIVKALRGL